MNQTRYGIILSYASLALNNLIAILYTPVLLRYLGQSEYGLYSIVTAIVAYLTILDLGLGNTIVRYSALYKSEGQLDKLSNLYGLFLKIYLSISLIIIIGGFCLFNNIELFLNENIGHEDLHKAKIMLTLLIVNLAFTFPLSVFSSIVTAYKRFIFSKSVNILRILLQPLIMTPLLIWGYKAITLVVIVSILNLGSLIANMLYALIKLKITVRWGKVESSLIKEIFAFSFYIFLGVAVDRMNWSSGQIIIGMVDGTNAVAVYAIAIQILLCFFGFASSVSGIFLPQITEYITKPNHKVLCSDLFIKIGRLQYIILLLVFCGFIFYGKPFIHFWAGNEYMDAYMLSIIIMFPLMLTSIQHAGVLVLQAHNKQRFRSIVYFSLSILNLFVGYMLTKMYGPIGCAISFAGYFLIGNVIIMNIYFEKKIGIDIIQFWKEIIKSWPLVLITTIAGIVYLKFIPVNSISTLLLNILLFCITYLVCSYILYMNKYEQNLTKSLLKKLHIWR